MTERRRIPEREEFISKHEDIVLNRAANNYKEQMFSYRKKYPNYNFNENFFSHYIRYWDYIPDMCISYELRKPGGCDLAPSKITTYPETTHELYTEKNPITFGEYNGKIYVNESQVRYEFTGNPEKKYFLKPINIFGVTLEIEEGTYQYNIYTKQKEKLRFENLYQDFSIGINNETNSTFDMSYFVKENGEFYDTSNDLLYHSKRTLKQPKNHTICFWPVSNTKKLLNKYFYRKNMKKDEIYVVPDFSKDYELSSYENVINLPYVHVIRGEIEYGGKIYKEQSTIEVDMDYSDKIISKESDSIFAGIHRFI